jgi:hypothetical protein
MGEVPFLVDVWAVPIDDGYDRCVSLPAARPAKRSASDDALAYPQQHPTRQRRDGRRGVGQRGNQRESATTGAGERGRLAGGQRGRAGGFTTIADLDETLVVLDGDG